MFLGTYDYSIDSKGRLFIPAKLREGKALRQGKFIVTKGLEGCLYLYDSENFRNIVLSRLENMPVKNQQDARAFKRLLLSGAQDIELDDNGRIRIPRSLMDFAGLKKNVTILGVGQRIELWSSTKWEAYDRKAASAFQRLGKQLEI
ncbi:division/cell wall cluster transcriptional repressor MraZ [bacterium F11]|nr:division/cell wall cluster transcriptional repressor MraZ [bacterium F11]